MPNRHNLAGTKIPTPNFPQAPFNRGYSPLLREKNDMHFFPVTPWGKYYLLRQKRRFLFLSVFSVFSGLVFCFYPCSSVVKQFDLEGVGLTIDKILLL